MRPRAALSLQPRVSPKPWVVTALGLECGPGSCSSGLYLMAFTGGHGLGFPVGQRWEGPRQGLLSSEPVIRVPTCSCALVLPGLEEMGP